MVRHGRVEVVLRVDLLGRGASSGARTELGMTLFLAATAAHAGLIYIICLSKRSLLSGERLCMQP